MRSTSESKHIGADEGDLASPASKKLRIGIGRHEAAIVANGVRRLVRTMQPFGVMRKNVLKREAGAEHWHDYEFERALRAAVKTGAIRRLPFGFYAKTSDADRALHEHDSDMGRQGGAA